MSSDEFRKIILEKFKGKIFHITNEKNYKKILKSKAILATNDIKNKNINWGSENSMSYFRDKNCISLCDLFHNKDKKNILDAMENQYNFYSPRRVVKDKIAYYLVLKETIYDKCITWNSLRLDEKIGKQIVPHLESGIPNKILLSDIAYVVKLVTTEEFIDMEKYYMNLFKKLKEER